MKHLLKYNESAQELFDSDINKDLIQDLKDISLDYIDEGYSLLYYVSIYNRKSNKYEHLFTGRFDHSNDGVVHSNDAYSFYNIKVTNFLKNLKPSFKYIIYLTKDSMDPNQMDPNQIECNKKVFHLITKMYPDEEIQLIRTFS